MITVYTLISALNYITYKFTLHRKKHNFSDIDSMILFKFIPSFTKIGTFYPFQSPNS